MPVNEFLVSPVPPQASIGRIDQGVDITSKQPFLAVLPGVITHIDPNFYKGTPAVYETLDTPVLVNGHTYNEVYYSETPSLVQVGQRVSAGTPVVGAGTAELGFASGDLPAGHSEYTFDGKVTQAGKDFASALARVLYVNPQDQTPDTKQTIVNEPTGMSATTSGPSTGGVLGFLGGGWDAIFSWILSRLQRLGLILGGAILIILAVALLAKRSGAVPNVVPV